MTADLSKYSISDPNAIYQQVQAEPEKKKSKKRSEDTRFWKPNLNNPKKIYQAMVRALPRDIAGKLGMSVRQDMHYIKDEATNSFLFAKCRKTLGDNEKCPICDANWAMYNTKRKDLMDISYERRNQTTYIGNFLIVSDLVRPEFNGQVKLWDHRPWMSKFIESPMKNGVVLVPSTEFGVEPKMEQFIPYDLINGHNLIVDVKLNPENNIATYANSFWHKDANPVHTTSDGIEEILSRMYDLSEFTDDVPSIEELARLYQEFTDKVSSAGANVAYANTPQFNGYSAQPNYQQGVASQPAQIAGFGQATPAMEGNQQQINTVNTNDYFAGAQSTPQTPTQTPQTPPTQTPQTPQTPPAQNPMQTQVPQNPMQTDQFGFGNNDDIPMGEDDLPF